VLNEFGLKEMQLMQIEILKQVGKLCEENDLRHYMIGGTCLGAVRHSGFIPWDDDIDIGLPRPDYDKLELICRAQLPERYTYVNYKDDFRIPNNISKVYDNRTVLIEEARQEYQVELGVYIDIFPLDGVPSSPLTREVHYYKTYFLKSLMQINSMDNSRRRSLLKKVLIAFVQMLMNDRILKAVHDCFENTVRKYQYCTSQEICNYSGAWGKRELIPRDWIGEGATLVFEDVSLKVFREYRKYLSRLYGDYLKLPPIEKQKSHHRYRVYRITT
jgi:lipopolysaccharide cholinephosphotransferase